MATETTDSMTLALHAMALMDERAVLVRSVATQVVAEHSDSLPNLSDVRVEASTARMRVALQARTEADVREWAQALGVALESPEPDRDLYEGGYYAHTVAEFVVDGVDVHLVAVTWVSTREAVAA